MPTIELMIDIAAPIERCFDLSLSVDLHTVSTKHTGEKAVDGITEGIMKKGDYVTWEATHFGIKQRLTTKIADYNRPYYFVSRMLKGAFKKMHHQHLFHEQNGITTITDVFKFEAPFGLLGTLAEKLFLTGYMRRLLIKRNETIKQIAEGDSWQLYTKAE